MDTLVALEVFFFFFQVFVPPIKHVFTNEKFLKLSNFLLLISFEMAFFWYIRWKKSLLCTYFHFLFPNVENFRAVWTRGLHSGRYSPTVQENEWRITICGTCRVAPLYRDVSKCLQLWILLSCFLFLNSRRAVGLSNIVCTLRSFSDRISVCG